MEGGERAHPRGWRAAGCGSRTGNNGSAATSARQAPAAPPIPSRALPAMALPPETNNKQSGWNRLYYAPCCSWWASGGRGRSARCDRTTSPAAAGRAGEWRLLGGSQVTGEQVSAVQHPQCDGSRQASGSGGIEARAGRPAGRWRQRRRPPRRPRRQRRRPCWAGSPCPGLPAALRGAPVGRGGRLKAARGGASSAAARGVRQEGWKLQ